MPIELVGDWLTRLNVKAVSLANNHTMDLGLEAYQEMVRLLGNQGVIVLTQGDVKDMGPFRLVALTDISNRGEYNSDLISEDVLKNLDVPTIALPLIAFVHWGREAYLTPRKRELEVAFALRQRAISGIIGAHNHKASTKLELLAGGETIMAYSIGNFLFDQSAKVSSGSLIELRFFEQGTFFVRRIELPNLYDIALKLRKSQDTPQ